MKIIIVAMEKLEKYFVMNTSIIKLCNNVHFICLFVSLDFMIFIIFHFIAFMFFKICC